MKRQILAITTLAGVALLAACTPPASDQHLQEQAEQATETAKQQSKEALAQARVAASNAERAVNDVAAGVKQGMNSPGGSGPRLDANSASQAELAGLPGISLGKAHQIVKNRPYATNEDLVKSGVLTQSQLDAIAPRLTAQ